MENIFIVNFSNYDNNLKVATGPSEGNVLLYNIRDLY